jgi:carnitine O-acetyltransferase
MSQDGWVAFADKQTYFSFGIGYIIKDDGVSIVAASKHLQTRRFLDTLQAVFLETQRMIRQLYADANRGIGEFIDHASVLREEDTLVEEAEGLDGVAEESLEGYGVS